MLLARKRPRYRLWSIPGTNQYWLKRKYLWFWLPVLNRDSDYYGFKWLREHADDYVASIYAMYSPKTKKRLKSTLQKEYI